MKQKKKKKKKEQRKKKKKKKKMRMYASKKRGTKNGEICECAHRPDAPYILARVCQYFCPRASAEEAEEAEEPEWRSSEASTAANGAVVKSVAG